MTKTTGYRLGLTCLAVLVAAGCGRDQKRAAAAILRADRMVTALRDRSVKVFPEETKGLEDSLVVAKSRDSAGEYRAAYATAIGVQAKAIEVANSIPSKSTELSSAFMAFSAELPGSVEEIQGRINRLARGALPPGVDRAKFDALRDDVPSWSGTWRKAVKDFQSGDLALAMAAARTMKQKVDDANALLGIVPEQEGQTPGTRKP